MKISKGSTGQIDFEGLAIADYTAGPVLINCRDRRAPRSEAPQGVFKKIGQVLLSGLRPSGV
jgi:hypothetical protein